MEKKLLGKDEIIAILLCKSIGKIKKQEYSEKAIIEAVKDKITETAKDILDEINTNNTDKLKRFDREQVIASMEWLNRGPNTKWQDNMILGFIEQGFNT